MRLTAELEDDADQDFDPWELRSLIDGNADGILVVDGQGVVRLANPAALALFGRDAGKLVGQPIGLPLVVGETTTIDLLRPDGTALEVEMRAVETVWRGEQALLASLRDVSERRRLEEQLRQSQKMEAVGRLTAGVAHDFNNLLTIVLGNLDSIQRRLPEDFPDTRVPRYVANATEGARRAAELTQQLLAFSRRQPLTPKVVEPEALIAGMKDLLTRTLGAAIQISIDVAPGTWPIMVDASQLEAALINLAVNAKDAMGSFGTLSIRAENCGGAQIRELGEPGEFVCISVSDTGEGIPEDVTPHVFEPFFTTKEVGQGTGLGLSQVYGFVKQSAGHVGLESIVGEGTTIRLYLPRHIGPTPADRASPVGAGSRSAGRTVLLVEDEEAVLDLARTSLEELGYEVVEARSAPEALEVLKSDRDLLLMFTDVALPGGMSGSELAEIARTVRPEMKVLVTTAYAGDALLSEGRLAPDVELISKPYSHGDLEAALKKILPARREAPRILLVEDDRQVRQTLSEALADAGCSVEEAANAKDALARLEDEGRSLDAAVIDLGLPDGSGAALLQALRDHHPNAAVIVASGYIDDEEFRKITADRRVAILEKPFAGEDLRRVLAEAGVLPSR